MIHLCAAPILLTAPCFFTLGKEICVCCNLFSDENVDICEVVRTPVSAQCQGTTRAPLGEEGPRPTHQLAIGNSAKRRLRPRPRTMHVERLLVKQACEAWKLLTPGSIAE